MGNETATIELDALDEAASNAGLDGVVTPDQILEKAELVVLDEANPASPTKFAPASAISREEIDAAKAEVDMDHTNTLTRFGAEASRDTTTIAKQMLEGVRNKDVGPVGEVISGMMLQIRGLDTSDLKNPGFWAKMKSSASRLVAFTQKYEKVDAQITRMGAMLDTHQTVLMTSVAMMDRLYDAAVGQFHALEVYIIAGEEILADMNANDIPAMQVIIDAETDGADGTPAALMPQKFRDLQNKRDILERVVHDRKMVRMVTLQALPKIRVTQDSDNNLIGKIDTIASTTISLWTTEVAMALEMEKTKSAADAISSVVDATDEMLRRGADQFKEATISARLAVERSVVGIDAVEYANQVIIETLGEVVSITEDGKKARAQAEQSLVGLESALRGALTKTARSQDQYASNVLVDADAA